MALTTPGVGHQQDNEVLAGDVLAQLSAFLGSGDEF
jgi:hypothetical protein